MIKVALTGGIASGKSFVSRYLKKNKILVHESDVVVSDIYKKPKLSLFKFLNNNDFKGVIVNKKIDKAIIRQEIFKNATKRRLLEKYIHKKVNQKRETYIKQNINKKIIFFDIPLLFENNLEKKFDYVCSTICSVKLRETRALKRKGINKDIFKKILKSQTTDKVRKLKSDYLISTQTSKIKTCLQVDRIIYDINKNKK